MKLYLDMCALKRPFDDRSQPRIDAEARAVLDLVAEIELGVHELVWSEALSFENNADPDPSVRDAVTETSQLANALLAPTAETRVRAALLASVGLRPLDSAHLAFAEAAGCFALVTCDDRFISRARRITSTVRVVNPLELPKE